MVEQWLQEQIAAKVTGTFVNPRDGRTTFASYYAEWSERQIWTHGTRRAMDLTARSVTFADVPLRQIRRSHVELWVKAMQTQDRGTDAAGGIRQGLAPQTIKTRLINARTVFRAAIVDRKIATDPTLGVRLPQTRKAAQAMKIPTPDEVRGILAAAAPHQRALFAVCAFAGLRLGEASALQVGDIDFMKRTIAIRRQAQKTRGSTLEIRLPKYGSERVVAAADGLLTLLGAHVALHGLQGAPGAFLFASESGGPAAPSTVHHAWTTARDKVTSGGYHLHDLRHFYASGLIAAGCDVATVQHALGHASATTTLRIYTHLWPKADDRTRAAAQGMLDASLGAVDEFLTNAAASSA
ncbi:tyrosine-type recombinase/integrase [Agromyces indicus]|uniref:Site-specific integrase n=1 Tax=Agromyces indicus TaxID=758919 RepID=A0ABU1FJF8_9MICO|nr:site-specific integrase [Agromyces indicus]MDR5691900.1 site-specific integrase [Agromyces indicus]